MTKKFEDINFDDPTPASCDVTIGGQKYTLREADGTASVEYRNAMLDATELGEGGRPVRLHGFASADPALVSRCLRDPAGNLVPIAVILSWKAEVYTRMADWVKDVSGMIVEARPKNGEKSTEGGSDSPVVLDSPSDAV
mgnify:CR=1 FL=1